MVSSSFVHKKDVTTLYVGGPKEIQVIRKLIIDSTNHKLEFCETKTSIRFVKLCVLWNQVCIERIKLL